MNLSTIPNLTDLNMNFYSELLERVPILVDGYLVYRSKTQSVKIKVKRSEYKPPVICYN